MITGNIAYGGLEAYNGGGGIWCLNPYESGSTPIITNCTISGNTTYYQGGGICIYNDANPVISNCTITDNLAQFFGAGVNTNQTSLEISNCLISYNYSAISGGGIICGYTFSGQSITIKNCIISANYAERTGGGLDGGSSNFSIMNCTIYGNSANNGGGIYCDACNVIDPIIQNCIFWNNTPDEIKLKDTSPVITYCDIKGGWQGEGNIDKKPLFVSILDFEYLLHPKSPCIDAGDPSIQDYVYDWHPKCPEWYKDGARSDMGAYGGPGNKYWLKDRWKPISEKAKKE
jgi:parallel beta-helix repeat protein